MTEKMGQAVQWGLSNEVPTNAPAAWGARWIFPNEMLHDRQGFNGWGTPEGEKLKKWLDGGAIKAAREEAKRLSTAPYPQGLTNSMNKVVVLFEDDYGTIKGNPNASFGYLYVCAYPHKGKTTISPLERSLEKDPTLSIVPMRSPFPTSITIKKVKYTKLSEEKNMKDVENWNKWWKDTHPGKKPLEVFTRLDFYVVYAPVK
jgi:hypothetical protein